MIRIAICDDEAVICDIIAENIEKFRAHFLETIQTTIYTNGESLYEDLCKGRYFDLIFLDIELYMLNGIEIGTLIRKNLDNQLTQIVYISSKQRYALDLFATHPLDFLLKPFAPAQVLQCLKLTLKMRQRAAEYFCYQTKGMMNKVALTDIYFFESKARKVKLHYTGGEDEFYGKLTEVYDRVKSLPFLYIHKSYIVNYLWVKTNKPNEMILENGRILPVSRSMQKQVIERISQIRMDGMDKWN